MKNDKIVGLIIFVLGLTSLFLTSQIPVKTFTDDPGPRIFPYFGSGILVICGLGILFLQKRNAEDMDATPFLTKDGWKRAGMITLLFIVYGLALKFLGFHIATPIMVYLFYHQIAGPGRRFLFRGIIYSLATYGTVYLVFSKLLNAFLPPGIIF